MIALGDSFHDRRAESRIADADGARLSRLTSGCDWVWIEGNHDPAPAGLWGGRVAEEIVIGPLVFRHQAEDGRPAGEISGHYHPKLSVAVRGRTVTGRCFLSDGLRLVLPAFGAFTGGWMRGIRRFAGCSAGAWMPMCSASPGWSASRSGDPPAFGRRIDAMPFLAYRL